eukprot:TRINITY_DN1682_c0_g1_i3.p1 TRINITY_DN1682_c0_g1~~TRINITY_DN1682_c0_g1_i3.p1  ORF type:complete len:338 (-),score=8.85 TRINITY_DN1682_c0_g1_i3:145-1158(-)
MFIVQSTFHSKPHSIFHVSSLQPQCNYLSYIIRFLQRYFELHYTLINYYIAQMIFLGVLRWGINLMVWAVLIVLIWNFAVRPSSSGNFMYLVVLLVLYCCYLLSIFSNSTFVFLRRMNSADDTNYLISYLTNALQSTPKIEVRAESYHITTTTDVEGRSSPAVAVTSFASEIYNYLSCRDISGPLVINTEAPFLKVKFELTHVAADEETATDLESIKKRLFTQLENDDHYRVEEVLSIDGLERSKLFKMKQGYPRCVGMYWYMFFGLLTFGNAYDEYVRCHFNEVKFKVVKLISAGRMLTDDNILPEQKSLAPTITLRGELVPIKTQAVFTLPVVVE